MTPTQNSSCIRLFILVLVASLLAIQTAHSAAPRGPVQLRVHDALDPVGTDGSVYFGWWVQDADKNEVQTKYQILVATTERKLNAGVGDVWDSGAVASSRQNHVAYGGQPLRSDTRYFWKVRTWDRNGNAGRYSLPGKFVVGLLNNADWSDAKWIRRTTTAPDDYTYYRKGVLLPRKSVERATVYISGVHSYALYLNGLPAGTGAVTHHPQYQYYHAHDVTQLVKAGGTNVFAVFNHWFGGGQGRATNARGLIMKAVIHYTDGTSATIGTDGSWRQSQAMSWILGQPQHNAGEGVGFIERIDARNLVTNWNAVSFDDSAWSAATVIGAPPVAPWTNVLAADLTRVVEKTIAPASITHKGGGKYVVDLGKVYAGVPRIVFSGGAAGDAVNMVAGYGLRANGEIDPAQNQNTDMRFFAVLDGKTFSYEPVTYLGMRYFQIDNSPMPITAANFKFIVRYSAMGETNSSFQSSDVTLNKVWDLMKHSLFTCAQESFVDTPTREKGGFLGDGAIQSTVAMPVTYERLLTRRTLHEFLQSMEQHWSGAADRGRMNAVYPNNDGGRDIPDFTQAYLVWVWEYYLATGDRSFLATNYGKLKDIADYLHRFTDRGTGLITNLVGGSGQYRFGIVDWPASMRYGYDMSTTARAVINHWAYADYGIISQIAGELGNATDRETYHQRAETLKSAINRQLLNTNGVYVDGLLSSGAQSAHVSQHANMFPLALRMVPPAHAASVLGKVKDLKMNVGMVTVMWLVRALGETDEGAHLVELYTNPTWEGWAKNLARGATATWESWNSDTDGGSQSHAWGAAGLYGYVHYILGIKPLTPQYEHVQIKPLDCGAKLTSAKGMISTDRGEISVEWNREAGQYSMKVNLPANVTATVSLPKGAGSDLLVKVDGKSVTGTVEGNYISVKGIGSGTHTFVRGSKSPSRK